MGSAGPTMLSWDAQMKRLNTNSHWTLVHGDFWPGNVLLSTNSDNQTLKMLDWEMVGIRSGPQDLGQYVLSNMDPAERRGCEKELIQGYFNELTSSGKVDMTWDECWNEYRIGGLERWLWFLVYFAGQTGPLLNWGQFFHDQVKNFLYDRKVTPDEIGQPRP